MPRFRPGDVVVFAEGWDARRVSNDVGGDSATYRSDLTHGTRIVSVEYSGGDSDHHRVTLQCGYHVNPICLQLKENVPEVPGEWAERWAKLMKGGTI